MNLRTALSRALIGATGALAIGSALVIPTLAVPVGPSVEQEILSGTLTAEVADASMNDIAYSHTQGSTTGQLHLNVSDMRGTSAGWSVTVSSTDFVYLGSSPTGADIPATGFSITNAHDPSHDAGQSIDTNGGPYKMNTGSLDQARTTIGAEAAYGSGDYSQDLDVKLVIPALSQAGLYVATLTVSTTAAP